jgi:hypothetical protein
VFRVGINRRPQAVGVKKSGPRSPNFNVVVVEAAKFFLHSRAFIYPAQEHSEGGIFNIEIGVAGGPRFLTHPEPVGVNLSRHGPETNLKI